MRVCLLLSLALLIAACGAANGDGPLGVAVIAEPDSLFDSGPRLSPAAQHLRSTTNEGLVALDPAGQVVPALAERWIVTEDGQSYIFRLRESRWPDGKEITAAEIRQLLRAGIAALKGTSLGLDLAKIKDIRAMTGRVIEIRLTSPQADFLRLLAQPELGFVKSGSGAGPMVASRSDNDRAARLTALPPEARGLPAREDWEDFARPLMVRALPATDAVAAFRSGAIDLVLGGRLADFPLAEVGPLSRGTIQVDPAIGLFGLAFQNDKGLLADPGRREALSMAIDRAAVIAAFGIGGWRESSWIVPPEFYAAPPYPESRWDTISLDDRRRIAAARIAVWKSGSGSAAVLRVRLPEGPGSALLLRALSEAWGTIGIEVRAARAGEAADLELRDTLARFSSPRWFLNQFHCSLKLGLCSPRADALVRESLDQSDPAVREALFAEAHAALIEAEAYIPLGAPVRWSLVRGSVGGFAANPWGLHPLFPLSQPTT